MGFIQSQAVAVSLLTRASTSYGTDLDSFVADYNLQPPRQAATYDIGQVIFTRNQASSSSQVLLVGTTIQTPTPSPASSVQYTVIADATNVAYSPNAGGVGVPGYTLAAGLTQFAQNPLAQAVLAGPTSNVISGALTVIASPNVPFDNSTNPYPIDNAQPTESDQALLARFTKYIAGLATANYNAIGAAILGAYNGLTYVLNDRLYTDGSAKVAYFTAVIDDGSGAIPSGTLTLTSNAINAKRAEGIGFSVIAPTNETINVAVTGTAVWPSFNATNVRTSIQAAIIAYVNANGVSGANAANFYVPTNKVSYVGIANVVASFIGVNASQGLQSYGGITVNSGTVDIALTTYQLGRSSISTVSVS